MIIPTKKLIPEAKLPEQQHVQDAGFDLYATSKTLDAHTGQLFTALVLPSTFHEVMQCLFIRAHHALRMEHYKQIAWA